MAFADLGMMGTAGTTTANENSLICTATTAGAAVGNLVVVAVAVDNRVTGGGDDLSVSGVTDSVGNVYLKARQNATNLAAQAGTSVSIWWSVIKTAIPVTTGTITASFTTNTTSDAQCMAVRKYSRSAGKFIGVPGTNATTSTTANPGSLNVTTDNAEHLRIRAIGCEYDSTQTLTVTAGGWAAWTEAASAATGTIAEQCLEVEWLINTSTGTASAPTLGSACDNSSVYVAFQEVTPVPEIIDPPRKTVRTTSQTVAIIAALSAVAEPVFVPPVVPETSTQASVHSTAVVVPSLVVYDQTSTPVFQLATPATIISSTLSGAYGTTTVVTSRVVYDQTSTPVFVPPTVVVAPAFGYQTFDAVWLRQRKVRLDGVVVPPTRLVTITPVAPSDPVTGKRRKNLPDGYAAPVTVPVAALTYGALGTSCTVVRTSIVIGDQTSTPVFPPEPPEPPEPVAGQFVSDDVLNWTRHDRIKPVPLSAFVLAYPYDTISSTLASVHSTAVVRTSRVVYDQSAARPINPPIFVSVAGRFVPDAPQNWLKKRNNKPPLLSAFVLTYEVISSKLVGTYGAVTVITSRVVYDQTSAPVFRPLAVTPPDFGYQRPDAVFRRQQRKILSDGVVQQLRSTTATPSDFGYQTVDAVWIRQRKVLPEGLVKPSFQTLAVTPSQYQTVDSVLLRQPRKILPEGYAAPVTSRASIVGAPAGFGYQTVDAVWRKQKKVLPEGYFKPEFRPLTATPTAFGYQTVDAVWRKFRKVRADDGFVRPLILPPPSPVVPPGAVTGGGGLGFSYQRYERLVNELYQKKKKAPPKVKKALAKALEVVKKVDTRAEDLARLLQALEAAAATSTQNTLATINAANAAAAQARLVLEQQRLRQLREEDDLILMMLEEED